MKIEAEAIRCSDNLKTASDLSFAECGALVTLGSRGASASFDLEAMSHLFVDGMIEVSNVNRRVMLTPQGDIAYAYLTKDRIPNVAWNDQRQKVSR